MQTWSSQLQQIASTVVLLCYGTQTFHTIFIKAELFLVLLCIDGYCNSSQYNLVKQVCTVVANVKTCNTLNKLK